MNKALFVLVKYRTMFNRTTLSVFLLCVFQCNLYFSEGANILVIPGNVNSHLLYFSRLGEGLAKLGHKVELLAPSNGKIPSHLANNNFTITSYKVSDEEPLFSSRETSEALLQGALSKSIWTQIKLMKWFVEKVVTAFESDCTCLLKDRKLIQRVQSDGFQFAIVDTIAANCYALLPHSMEIPYAPLSLPWVAWSFRVPRFSSFVSSVSLGYSDEMTFKQRFLSFIEETAMYMLYNDPPNNYTETYFQNKPIRLTTAFDLLQNSSFSLYLEDLSVGYPRPNMPNTLSIGDIMAGQPVNPLPQNLETFLDYSPDGAIVVSFGSYFEYVPEFLTQNFCEAFRQLKYHVIWKLKNDTICGNTQNVKILSWIPQNDLLAHPKVRLFITHGGINSLIESVYHAKPVIVFPIAFDQFGNAEVASVKGYGIRMDIAEFKAEELLQNIHRIVHDPSFAEKARFYSAIMKDKQTGPAERVSHMINHVIKYGDRHLRTGAFKLSAFQFFMFDIFLSISLIVGLVIMFILTCFWCFCRLGLRNLCRSTKTKIA